jgi:hypothetical protein
MTATFAPNGLTPSRIRGGAPNSNATNEYSIASGQASNIYTGQPVRVSAGYIVPLATATEMTIGVFQGCRYVQDGEQKFKSYWPGGTSATNAVGYVIDNPNQIYVIQADATVTQAQVGLNIGIEAIASGSTFTGRSGLSADVSTVASSGAALRILRVVEEPGNVAGDAYTKIEVKLNNHQDNFNNVLVSTPATTTN